MSGFKIVNSDHTSLQKNKFHILYVALFLCFLLLPTLTLFLFLFFICQKEKTIGKNDIHALIILSSIYLGLFNLTKSPESDLAEYINSFLDAREYNLIDYLLINTREPFYYITLYVLSNTLFLNEHFYIFFSTFIPYFIFLNVIHKICLFTKIKQSTIQLLITIFVFSPQLFSLSNHLLRQFFSAAVAMLFLSWIVIQNRKRWELGLLSFMLHYSALPIILIGFLEPLKYKSRFFTTLFYIFILFLSWEILLLIAPHFLDFPVIGLIFNRILADTNAATNPISIAGIAIASIILSISIWMLFFTNKHLNFIHDWNLLFCTMVISGLILATVTQVEMLEIATRYYLYIYFLFGLLAPLLLIRLPILQKILMPAVILIIPVFFYASKNGEWNYADLDKIFFSPSWSLWSHIPTGMRY